MNMVTDTASAAPLQPRFASGLEWLAWRLDWERGRQEIAEAKESTRRTLIELLPEHLEMDGPPVEYGDRIGAIYPCRRTDQSPNEINRVWIHGPNRPMSQPELESHFMRQIQAAVQ